MSKGSQENHAKLTERLSKALGYFHPEGKTNAEANAELRAAFGSRSRTILAGTDPVHDPVNADIRRQAKRGVLWPAEGDGNEDEV